MAKQKPQEQPENPEAADTPQEQPARKVWIVAVKGSNSQKEVVADTLEDAIRAFNGSATSYTRKQLDIVEG